jgi:hypothetical protein
VRITGADFLVLAADWDATHQGPPQIMGQLFHVFESPNRFGAAAVLHTACVGVEAQPERD